MDHMNVGNEQSVLYEPNDVVVFVQPVLYAFDPEWVGEEGWLGLVIKENQYRVGTMLIDFGDCNGDLSKTNPMWVGKWRLENLGPL